LAASSLKSVDECGVVADIFESGHVFLGQVLLKSLKVLSPHLVSFFAQFKSEKTGNQGCFKPISFPKGTNKLKSML
jgi:hypothetical protein